MSIKCLWIFLTAAAVAAADADNIPAKSRDSQNASTPASNPATGRKKPPKSKEKTEPQQKDQPLLLLDEPQEKHDNGKPVADNSRCAVCHINLIKEELAAKHAKAGVGCAKCHGESDAHIADESWASGGNGTPPEIMYPKDKINSGCMNCHKAEKVFVKIKSHKQDVQAMRDGKLVCTECHGEHKMANRKCKWK